MDALYPPIEPYTQGRLAVSELHTIYYEECGTSAGTPVVFLHGGPGGGIVPEYRRFFDPGAFRVVLFDQRGAGQSTPHAELEENTTWDLVADIERLREHLGIESWIVFGGSWGSTLALAYAETHPDRVRSLVLRGIFLCRPKEIRWFYQEGASFIFPEAWHDFERMIPTEERGDMLRAYHRRLTGDSVYVRLAAARAWSVWEASTSKLLPDQNLIDEFDDPALALAFARIESHYFVNHAFFPTDNYLIENAGEIQGIPTTIVQGRYDMVCPAVSAWELKQALPAADLQIVLDAGHSSLEQGIAARLVAAMNDLRGAKSIRR